jgi:hypothetical protein
MKQLQETLRSSTLLIVQLRSLGRTLAIPTIICGAQELAFCSAYWFGSIIIQDIVEYLHNLQTIDEEITIRR